MAKLDVFSIALGASFLQFTIAYAMVPRGPPPWICEPHAACNSENVCVPILGPPLSFEARVSGENNDILVLRGQHATERKAARFPSLDQAQKFVETDGRADQVSIVLIPNDEIADAHSFWVHTVFTRGSGGRFVGTDRVLVSCVDIRRD